MEIESFKFYSKALKKQEKSIRKFFKPWDFKVPS